MKDAELMTTSPDVPGLEVRELATSTWAVHVNRELIGLVGKFLFKEGYFATLESSDSPDFPTRNDAVQWILDQHKEQK